MTMNRLLNKVFGVKSNKESLSSLSMEDIAEINARNEVAIRCLDEATIKNRLDQITANKNNASELLRNFGIAIIPDFCTVDALKEFSESLDDLIFDITKNQVPQGSYVECEQYIIDNGSGHFISYGQLANSEKPVVQFRSGQDGGMVDIFNIEKILGLNVELVDEAFGLDFILYAIQSLDKSVTPANINAYLNEGITKTRGFHVDSYKSRYKAFVYLTDVLTLDDGPYTYVPASHENSAYHRANQTLSSNLPNSTETPLIDMSRVIPILGRKGTLVISDQSGAHRGFPQASSAVRKVLVMNYK